MNATALARHYDKLTPEERFRLILPASGRGDETERDRLVDAAETITVSMPNHHPYGHAFEELALITFIELLEEAAFYLDCFVRLDEAHDLFGEEEDDQEADGESDEEAAPEEDPAPEVLASAAKEQPWHRFLGMLYAAGFIFRTKVDGWKLFCERLTVPPFLLWEELPGFDRLQRALAATEKSAFSREGFLRWWNAVRTAGEPELTEVRLTPERLADATEATFRKRVEWWGG